MCTYSLVISKYIADPFLVDNKYKNDLRVYVLVAKTNPCICFFHGGKMRLSAHKYIKSEIGTNKGMYANITNAHIQKTHSKFEGTNYKTNNTNIVFDWDETIDYIYKIGIKQFDKHFYPSNMSYNKIQNLSRNEFKKIFHNNLIDVLRKCLESACIKFDNFTKKSGRFGQFAFFGVDILLDKYGKSWILEWNSKPSIQMVGTENIKTMTKNLLSEMVDITCEIRKNRLNGINITKHNQIKSIKIWEPIYLKQYNQTKH